MIIIAVILSQFFSIIPLIMWIDYHRHNGTLCPEVIETPTEPSLDRYEPVYDARVHEWERIKYKKQN